jgi:Asp-tRNA(Asn)/Glu-tRNA(Gln) amidotransferase C subunit
MLSDIPQSSTSEEITEEDVRRAARIARLALDAADLPRFIADLRDIRAASGALDALDTGSIADSPEAPCPRREDLPSTGLPHSILSDLVPEMRGPHVSMPAMSWTRTEAGRDTKGAADDTVTDEQR